MIPLFKGIRPLNPLSLAIEVVLLFGSILFIYARLIRPGDVVNSYLIISTGLLFYGIVSTIMLIISENMTKTWLLAFSCYVLSALALCYLGNFATGVDLIQIKPFARLIKVLSMSFVVFITIGMGIKQIADFTKRMK